MERSRNESAAIVIMAKPPIVGHVKTRLCPPLNSTQATDLHAAMLFDTMNKLEMLQDVSLFLASGENGSDTEHFIKVSSRWTVIPQGGGDLGQRLYGISAQLITNHQRIIFLGADSPTIPLALIREAIALTGDPDEIVLVGSDDGGYCLLGLAKTREELFRDIDWSTDRVMDQTVERTISLGLHAVVLGVWYDVDDFKSLDRLRQELAKDPDTAPQTYLTLTKLPTT